LVFITEKISVYCAVRTGSLNKLVLRLSRANIWNERNSGIENLRDFIFNLSSKRFDFVIGSIDDIETTLRVVRSGYPGKWEDNIFYFKMSRWALGTS